MSLSDEIACIPSPNHDERRLPVRFIILHYTGMVEDAVGWMANPASKVSAHYHIAEDGAITRLVDERHRAWHAGVSRWGNVTDLNSASIGIELENPGHEWGYRAFPEAQMRNCVRLVNWISVRHRIDRAHVLGHSDIAPTRKQDPGELFDWPLLAHHRLALARPERLLADPCWPDGAFMLALERFGYDIAEPEAAIRAFQRRFRPAMIDGVIDGETRAILFTLQVLEEQRLRGPGA